MRLLLKAYSTGVTGYEKLKEWLRRFVFGMREREKIATLEFGLGNGMTERDPDGTFSSTPLLF